MISRALAALALLLAPLAAAAERDDATVFVFGNSLVNHLDETRPHTNVPHWLNLLAQAGGRDVSKLDEALARVGALIAEQGKK